MLLYILIPMFGVFIYLAVVLVRSKTASYKKYMTLIMDRSIIELQLSKPLNGILIDLGIFTVGQLLNLTKATLLQHPEAGDWTVKEVRAVVKEIAQGLLLTQNKGS